MPLHYYVTVDMDAVVELVDSVGGIKFNVPYDVIDKDGVLQIPKGERILDGEKYLHYLRNREVGGDIGRMQRQLQELVPDARIGHPGSFSQGRPDQKHSGALRSLPGTD